MSSVNREKYIKRIIDPILVRYLNRFGAVCIEGPKWCGKTWTASYHSKSEFLVSLSAGDYHNKRLAEMSPFLVLQGDNPRLIDKWQDVQSLWDAVRIETDKRGEKGLFVLTGSAGPRKDKKPLHSGAGRIGKLKMDTMSLYETGDSTYNWQYRKIPQNRVLGPFWPVRILATKFLHAPLGLKMHDENRARSGPYHIAHEIPPANSDFEFAESIFVLRFRIYSASL